MVVITWAIATILSRKVLNTKICAMLAIIMQCQHNMFMQAEQKSCDLGQMYITDRLLAPYNQSINRLIGLMIIFTLFNVILYINSVILNKCAV